MDQNDNSFNRNESNRGDRNRNRGGFNRPKSNKEWKLIERMVMSAQDEQRKSRRWGIFFKFATLAYLIVALLLLGPGKWSTGEPNPGKEHTAVVKLDGAIMADSDANAARLIKGLRALSTLPSTVPAAVRCRRVWCIEKSAVWKKNIPRKNSMQ